MVSIHRQMFRKLRLLYHRQQWIAHGFLELPPAAEINLLISRGGKAGPAPVGTNPGALVLDSVHVTGLIL